MYLFKMLLYNTFITLFLKSSLKRPHLLFYDTQQVKMSVCDCVLNLSKSFFNPPPHPNQSAHMHMIDHLMMAYTVEMISIEKVVDSVKRFSTFSSSQELPFDLEDAMIFWINKVQLTAPIPFAGSSTFKRHRSGNWDSCATLNWKNRKEDFVFAR